MLQKKELRFYASSHESHDYDLQFQTAGLHKPIISENNAFIN